MAGRGWESDGVGGWWEMSSTSGFVCTHDKVVVRDTTTSALRRKWIADKRHKASASAALKRHGSAGSLAPPPNAHAQAYASLNDAYLRNLQQQIYFLELENGQLKGGGSRKNGVKAMERRGQRETTEVVTDAETRTTMANLRISHHTPHKGALVRAGTDHIAHQHSGGQQSQQLHFLKDEVVDLRRAVEEAELGRAGAEERVEEAGEESEELRRLLHQSQADLRRLHDQSAKWTASQALADEREREMSSMVSTVRRFETEAKERKGQFASLSEELASAKDQLRQTELQLRKERALAEKVSEENSSLIKENGGLTGTVAELESRLSSAALAPSEPFVHSELAEAREAAKRLRAELARAEELLRLEGSEVSSLGGRVRELEAGLSGGKEALVRLEGQLHGLEAQLRSAKDDAAREREERDRCEASKEDLMAELHRRTEQLRKVQSRVGTLEALAVKVQELGHSVPAKPLNGLTSHSTASASHYHAQQSTHHTSNGHAEDFRR